MDQFILRQPGAPQETSTDRYYLDLANRLVAEAKERGLFASYPEKVVERTALAVTGYYQDVICDAGVWRSFINECRRLYGRTLPFFETGDNYVDYEFNAADVRFMCWYALSMNYEDLRVSDPLSGEIEKGAAHWASIMEEVYDESPMPEDYRICHELEMHAKEDQQDLYRLANWLFMHCYLMTPAFALTLSEIASGIDFKKPDATHELQEKLAKSMSEDPTGPLALYTGEWLYLIVDGKLPSEKRPDEKEPHKFYKAVTEYTGGKTLVFLATYGELNEFFIKALGWEAGEEHLPMMKKDRDFVVMVDRGKGMLVARNIARCIAAPDNVLYDKDYASSHAIDLLTVRGVCPGDLLRKVCREGWLPDAVFPGSESHGLVADNWDFIARCYLQQYYRGD